MSEADNRKHEDQGLGVQHAAADNTEAGREAKEQFVDELVCLHQRISALNPSETQREAIETDLNGIRQRLQYLLAVSPAVIYATRASDDHACSFVSRNLQAIMGYSPQEMTTDPKHWPDHLHREDASRVISGVGPLIEQGGGTLEYRFRHRDGHYVWIQDTFKVIYDEPGHASEIVGAWADITERKQAEQAALEANGLLQETKRYLTRLIDSSTDAIFSTSKEGNVVLFNGGSEALLGYRAEDVIGRPAGKRDCARDAQARGQRFELGERPAGKGW